MKMVDEWLRLLRAWEALLTQLKDYIGSDPLLGESRGRDAYAISLRVKMHHLEGDLMRQKILLTRQGHRLAFEIPSLPPIKWPSPMTRGMEILRKREEDSIPVDYSGIESELL
jgi:hypothetical protein